MTKKNWNIIGLMSGTSLDGLDVAYCQFVTTDHVVIDYQIKAVKTYEYSEVERENLNIMNATAKEFAMADFAFGKYCGQKVKEFISDNNITADFISSHGHTIFHQPELGFTSQIGNGAAISGYCGLPVINDFRSMDVTLGGQGAPLVPIGDLLFKSYKYCLNLGGIANISIKSEDSIKAFDICPANMALNLIAREKGMIYDENGNLARSGKINPILLKELNSLSFYGVSLPKSLGKEWFDSVFLPILIKYPDSAADKLCTLCEHIAIQIAGNTDTNGELLITGGGALNSFLVECIERKTSHKVKITVPDRKLINFKEALIFAYLGLLRMLNHHNSLSVVTGARISSVGGALYGNFSQLIS